jgi:hypothetical protein
MMVFCVMDFINAHFRRLNQEMVHENVKPEKLQNGRERNLQGGSLLLPKTVCVGHLLNTEVIVLPLASFRHNKLMEAQ